MDDLKLSGNHYTTETQKRLTCHWSRWFDSENSLFVLYEMNTPFPLRYESIQDIRTDEGNNYTHAGMENERPLEVSLKLRTLYPCRMETAYGHTLSETRINANLRCACSYSGDLTVMKQRFAVSVKSGVRHRRRATAGTRWGACKLSWWNVLHIIGAALTNSRTFQNILAYHDFVWKNFPNKVSRVTS